MAKELFVYDTELRPEYESFFAKLGFAVAQWQNIEFEIYACFCMLVDTKHPPVAPLVYNVMQSHKAGMLTIDRYLQWRFGEQDNLYSLWSKVQGQTDRCYQRRNELAHWPQHSIITSHDPYKSEPALVPPLHKFPGLGKKKQEAQTEKKIDALISDIGETLLSFREFQRQYLDRTASEETC